MAVFAARRHHGHLPAPGRARWACSACIGYLLFGAFFLLVIAFNFFEVFVLPQLADEAPRFVNDSLALFSGGTVVGDLGLLKAANPISAVTYLLGGLLFGIALYRARILARWASAAARRRHRSPRSPCRCSRTRSAGMAAIPVGVALVGLGYSLMREQRAHDAVPSLRGARIDVAGAR